MNPTIRVVVGVAASLVMASVGLLLVAGLSQWIDSTYYQSKIGNTGYGLEFLVPAALGVLAGLLTGPQFVIADRKLRGNSSLITGAIGYFIAFTFYVLECQGNSGLEISKAFILCGPAMLWMIGLILYGIWCADTKRSPYILPSVAIGLALFWAGTTGALHLLKGKPVPVPPPAIVKVRKYINLAFVAQNKLLVVNAANGWSPDEFVQVTVWDTHRHILIRKLKGPVDGSLDAGSPFAVSPDGALIAQATPQGVIRLWSTETGKLRGQMVHRTLQTTTHKIDFSPDGELLGELRYHTRATCGWEFCEQEFLLWDVRAKKIKQTLSRSKRRNEDVNWKDIRTFVFSPSGNQIVGATPTTCYAWNTYNGRLMWEAKLNSPETDSENYPTITFSPDGKLLAGVVSAVSRQEVHWWDTTTGKSKGKAAVANISDIDLTFTPNNRLLAIVLHPMAEMSFYDVQTGRCVKQLQPGAGALFNIAPDSDTIGVIIGEDIELWSLSGGKLQCRIKGAGLGANQILFSSDSRLLAAAHDDGTFKLLPVTATSVFRLKSATRYSG